MNTLNRWTAAISAAGALAAPAAALAASPWLSAPAETFPHATPSSSTAHKVVSMYLDSGYMGAALPGGSYVNISGPTTVKCAAAAGCTLSSYVFVQLSAASAANVSLCVQVDGHESSNCYAYLGVLSPSTSYTGYSSHFTYKMPTGTHSVQTVAWMDYAGAGSIYDYEMTYTLTTP